MDTKLFTYFTALVRNRSVATAARELDMTPQGLSSAIRRLETELGVNLFSGALGTSALTDHGRFFLEYAQNLEASLVDLRQGMDSITAHANNVVKLACSIGILGYLGEEAIERFNDGDHGCQVMITDELPDQECERRLNDGDCDFALLIDPVDAGFMRVQIVDDYQFFWVNRRCKIAEKSQLSMADLDGQTVITMGDDYRNTGRFMDLAHRAGVRVDMRFTGEMIRVYELARAGRGLGLTCRNHIEATADSQVTVGIPIKELSWGFSLCYRRDYAPREAEASFIEYMRGLRKVWR